MEPNNVADKYAVAVTNKDRVLGKADCVQKLYYFSESRYQQYGNSEDKWEGCEQRKSKGNGSSVYI